MPMMYRLTDEWLRIGIGTLLLALVLAALLTRLVLALVRRRQLGQQVRDDGPESHRQKQGTPSLGGLAILAAVVLATGAGYQYWQARGPVLDPPPSRLCYVLGLALLFGLLGLVDDLSKMRAGSSRGIPARHRILIEIVLAAFFAWLVLPRGPGEPFGPGAWGFRELAHLPGWYWQAAYVALGAFVIVGAANAVNFTDGVDGLAATTVAVCAAFMAVAFARVLVPWWYALPLVGVAGAALGFLWFNAHPAKIFMGDVGSLGLGALLGGMAVATGMEWLFALCAVVFIVEVLSVMLQVIWFRCTRGKRLFRMTPIHHAFELRGWSEPQIVARFALAGLLAGGLALLWLFSGIVA